MPYTPYNPYANQFQNYPSFQQTTPQTNSGIVWVQGENGAKSFIVGAGQSVLLMDSEEERFYIKSADVSGMPSLRKFSYKEETGAEPPKPVNPEYITRAEFEEKIAELMPKKKKEVKENE